MKKLHLMGPSGLIGSVCTADELREVANRYLSRNGDDGLMKLYVTDDNKMNFIPFYQWLAEEAEK